MHNETNDIDQLFSKKFEKYEVKSSNQEWLDLSAKLGKVNFLKFSFASFNIYYLMVIVTLAATTTFSGIRNFQLSKEVQELEFFIHTNHEKKQIKNTVLPINNALEISNSKSAITNKISSQKNNVDKSETESKAKTQNVEENAETKNLNSDISAKVTEREHKQELQNKTDIETKLSTNNQSIIKDSLSEYKVRKIVKKTYVVKPKIIIVKDTFVVTKTIK